MHMSDMMVIALVVFLNLKRGAKLAPRCLRVSNTLDHIELRWLQHKTLTTMLIMLPSQPHKKHLTLSYTPDF